MCDVNLTAVQKLISDIGMFGQTYPLPEKTLLHSDFQLIETLHNSIACTTALYSIKDKPLYVVQHHDY